MSKQHVLAVSVPALGHVVPLMKLSLFLTKHDIKVTFVNYEFVHKLVVNASSTKDGTVNSIPLVSLPVGCEPETALKEIIEKVNASDKDKITCALADPALSWVMEVAEKMGIRRAILCPFAATGLVSMSFIPKLMEDGIIGEDGTPIKKQTIQLSPTMPAMETSHFVWNCRPNSEHMQSTLLEYALRCNTSMTMANKILSSSSYELEPAAFKMNPKILPIGPLLATNETGNLPGTFWAEDFSCLKWLDQQPRQSVIYIAFGSKTTFDQTQFQEFATALELCNRPFLWVVRPDFVENLSEASYPEGFHARVGARGLIITWAPQQKVLEHPSIACFFTHCGWNSTTEALANGVPLLCWPFITEQIHNQNYICHVWKAGVGFNREEGGLVMREEIINKLEELLANDQCRANALDLKEKLSNHIKQGGSSYNNFMSFVDWLKE